jgi:glycosyltransferase involved in cell wall biosynthesis
MDLSVIVCCYKGEETIEKCLESLCAQSYENHKYEVIIVDDDSIDDSFSRINSFLRNKHIKFPIIKYFKKENKGLSVARNFGIEKASSSLVSFIDEDAKADKDFVLNVVKTFKANPNINCLGGKVELWNSHDYFAKIYHYGYFNAMMNNGAIIGTNMSFRKNFLNEIGGFIAEFDKRGDESALFFKSKSKLSKTISDEIIIHHIQPNSKEIFFAIRNKNGSIQHLYEKLSLSHGFSILGIHIRPLLHFSFIIFPILAIISFLISYSIFFVFFGLFTLIFATRFFVLGHLTKPLRFLHKSEIKKSIKDYIFLSWIVVYGYFQEDLGYVRMKLFGK